MKTCACLLKAVCFAFDFVCEWRPTIQKKTDNNFNDTKNVMDKLTFCSKKLFYMPTAAYIRSSQQKMHRLICTLVVRIWHKQVFSWDGLNFQAFYMNHLGM